VGCRSAATPFGSQVLFVESIKREEKETMNLYPKLDRIDRVTNVVIGAALVVYSFLDPREKILLLVAVVGIGLVFIFGST
jgi:hypothetical protein